MDMQTMREVNKLMAEIEMKAKHVQMLLGKASEPNQLDMALDGQKEGNQPSEHVTRALFKKYGYSAMMTNLMEAADDDFKGTFRGMMDKWSSYEELSDKQKLIVMRGVAWTLGNGAEM